MGVYIKGVEMPKDDVTIIEIHSNGATFRIMSSGGWEKVEDAVPVPPHGRLIDADELAKVMAEGIAPSTKDGGFQHPFDIFRAISAAPTIIPADPLKEETE